MKVFQQLFKLLIVSILCITVLSNCGSESIEDYRNNIPTVDANSGEVVDEESPGSTNNTFEPPANRIGYPDSTVTSYDYTDDEYSDSYNMDSDSTLNSINQRRDLQNQSSEELAQMKLNEQQYLDRIEDLENRLEQASDEMSNSQTMLNLNNYSYACIDCVQAVLDVMKQNDRTPNIHKTSFFNKLYDAEYVPIELAIRLDELVTSHIKYVGRIYYFNYSQVDSAINGGTVKKSHILYRDPNRKARKQKP